MCVIVVAVDVVILVVILAIDCSFCNWVNAFIAVRKDEMTGRVSDLRLALYKGE